MDPRLLRLRFLRAPPESLEPRVRFQCDLAFALTDDLGVIEALPEVENALEMVPVLATLVDADSGAEVASVTLEPARSRKRSGDSGAAGVALARGVPVHSVACRATAHAPVRAPFRLRLRLAAVNPDSNPNSNRNPNPFGGCGCEPVGARTWVQDVYSALITTPTTTFKHTEASAFADSAFPAPHRQTRRIDGLSRVTFVSELLCGTPQGYATHLWDCAIVANTLQLARPAAPGAPVIELGAGCGLGALGAAAAGAKHILATEMPGDGLEFLRCGLCATESRVETAPLVWNDPATVTPVVSWLEKALEATPDDARIVRVIASDVLYNSRHTPALFATIRTLFAAAAARGARVECSLVYKCRDSVDEPGFVNVARNAGFSLDFQPLFGARSEETFRVGAFSIVSVRLD